MKYCLKCKTEKPGEEKKTCRICGEEKPIEQFRELLTNRRRNKKGVVVDYYYRDGRCDVCRKKENRERMANRKIGEKKEKRKVENVTMPYTKTHYDNAFVFSSDIDRWH